jgi:hypothetical protein
MKIARSRSVGLTEKVFANVVSLLRNLTANSERTSGLIRLLCWRLCKAITHQTQQTKVLLLRKGIFCTISNRTPISRLPFSPAGD